MLHALLIAPDVGLKWTGAEVSNVINSGLKVRVLQDHVTEQDILLELRRDIQLLYIASHGDDAGILISDGDFITTSALTSYCRFARVECVFLNTCSSLKVANQIQQESWATVIGTIGDIDDRVAWRTGSLFAAKLADSEDYRLAYEGSRPGQNTQYVYLAGDKAMPLYRREDAPDDVRGEIGKLSQRIEDMQTFLYRIDVRLSVMEAKLQEKAPAARPVDMTYIGLAILLSAIVVAILFIVMRLP